MMKSGAWWRIEKAWSNDLITSWRMKRSKIMGNTVPGGEQSGSPELAEGRRPPATPERPERSRQKIKSKLE